jgi:Domain of unknown function (DUF4185)
MRAVSRRGVLTKSSLALLALGTVPGTISSAQQIPRVGMFARQVDRLTGPDRDPASRWKVVGTDLGIPYQINSEATGFLFGDTFDTLEPEKPRNDWRSPVLLRSSTRPSLRTPIVFESAVMHSNGRAREIVDFNTHGDPRRMEGIWPNHEVTCIPNDAVVIAETGVHVLSFMSINRWNGGDGPKWRTRFCGLASSENGETFKRLPAAIWANREDNLDPYQMWTMQRDGEWIYVFSVRAGRQPGPMMLQRVHWTDVLSKQAYEGWGWNGRDWDWGRPCSAILTGSLGEPSVRKLRDGLWAMSYLNAETGNIVTRRAEGPNKVWSAEKIQVTRATDPGLYGGFIHPHSTDAPDDLHLMVSKWIRRGEPRKTVEYHVAQFAGTL